MLEMMKELFGVTHVVEEEVPNAKHMNVGEEEDDDDVEYHRAWPSGSSDNNDPVSTTRFPRVKHWFKCPICLNHLYQDKDSLFFHIKNFIMDELSMPNKVE
jgi:hypothetical protein